MTPPGYQLTERIAAEALVISAEGRFDREVGLEVQRRIEGHQGPSVLNLAKVDYISSSGVALLTKLYATLGVRISSVSECVEHTLSLAGILQIITLYRDDDAALNAQP